MIPTEITIPSEVNVFNIIGKSGEPLITSGQTYGFVTIDDCGNNTDIDISSFEFTFEIVQSGCIALTGGTVTGELMKGTGTDNNKLWFEIPSLDIDRGVYTYTIKMVNSNSVIQGELTVR